MEPNPMPGEDNLPFDEIDRRQRAWCRFRSRCLVLVGNAPSLDCRACRVGEQAAMDRTSEDFKAEVASLVAFGRVLYRLANASPRELALIGQRRRRAA